MEERREIKPGSRIGNYKVVEKMAEGGSGVIYRAVFVNDSGTEDALHYVIKEVEIPDALDNEKEITQGMENDAGFSVVIPILQVITQKDRQYAVMPCKSTGRFLSQLIGELEEKYGRGQIPLEQIFALIRNILRSLSVLHHSFGKDGKRDGYLHLDLQPANIFVENVDLEKGDWGSVKFIDFQRAVPVNHEGYGLRRDSQVYVSVGYHAPEMLRPDQRRVSRATDLYSVGCVAARMLTGEQIAFELDNYGERLHGEDWYGNRRDLDAATSCLLKNFFLCALEQGMELRFQDAWEMEQDLEQAERCYQAFLSHDYYEVYAQAWEMLVPREEIRTEKMGWNEAGFHRSVQRLAQSLIKDHIHPAKCGYLYFLLADMGALHEREVPPEDKISLLSSGIACCNHLGDAAGAAQLLGQLETEKDQMSVMEYMAVQNRGAEVYADLLDYEKALEIAKKSAASYGYMKEAYQKAAVQYGMRGKKPLELKGLGRAFSAMGRYQAFMGKGGSLCFF